MADASSLQAAIEGLGPADPDILSVVQLGDAGWVVRYDNMDVELEGDSESRAVALQADIGVMAVSGRADVYATLLKYNYLQRDTGGMTMAVKDDDTVVQMLRFVEEPLTTELLLTVLQNFIVKARVWRGLITSGLGTGPAAMPADDAMPFGLRI